MRRSRLSKRDAEAREVLVQPRHFTLQASDALRESIESVSRLLIVGTHVVAQQPQLPRKAALSTAREQLHFSARPVVAR